MDRPHWGRVAHAGRVAIALAAVGAFALGVLGAASARTHAPAKYGGVLVVGLANGEPDRLDPLFGSNTSALLISPAMCQRLYDYDAKQQLLPVLAAAVPTVSTDKLTYTIPLRKGVQFNDGTPFNAQAVVTTLQRYMAAKPSDFTGLSSVSASGPYTLVYHLKASDSTFVGGAPGAGGNPFVFSPTQLAKLGDNFETDPICVGPFMFDHRVVGDNVTLVKSPYYYDQKNVFLDKIVYKPVTDAQAADAALKAGDIQVLTQVSATELPAIQQSSSLRVISAPQLGWFGIVINIGNKNGAGNPPYTNVGTPLASSPKLRQAFEEAIDRDTLNRVVFQGLVQPSCTPIPPANTTWYDATKIPCTPYDPKHAKKLVAASGFSNPTVRLLTTDATDLMRMAEFIQAQEAAVGINVVIDVADSPTVAARTTSGDFDVRLGGLIPGGPDPDTNIYRRLVTSAVNNQSGYSSPRLDLLLSNARKATTFEARSTLYHAAWHVIQDDRPIIALYNPITYSAFSTNLTGVWLTSYGKLRVENAQYK
jgi:peptide/nickel transport system substrate-binding protein